jgi:hypothetical protein
MQERSDRELKVHFTAGYGVLMIHSVNVRKMLGMYAYTAYAVTWN